MSKNLTVISVALISLCVVLGILNAKKAQGLRAETIRLEAARQDSERARAEKERALKKSEAAVVAANAKATETEGKVANAEAELVKTQTEKTDLQAKLAQNETEIGDLKKQIEEASAKLLVPGGTPIPAAADLQAQLEETKKQLAAAESEKTLLSDKIRSAQERSEQLQQERKQRTTATGNPGVRGTILAVNQAYNFVVLNLGGRQGVESNAEMLVLRGGALIGRIRISSVEPSTAIGDIISSSLARGVQVQPGDVVIYAGSSS